MEVEDPISAKFRTIIEALMIKTTSEIVKVFTDVMLETRMEISRSWRQIDNLKQDLDRRENKQVGHKFRSQMTQVTFKSENEFMVVSQQNPLSLKSTASRGDVKMSENATGVEDMDNRQDSVLVREQTAPETTTLETPSTEALVPQLKSFSVSELHQTATETKVLPTSTIKTVPMGSTQQQSSSTDMIILNKSSQRKEPSVSKKKHISRQRNSVTHMLRDRHLLSSQKPCLCCSSGQSPQQQYELKKNSLVTSHLYTCADCGKKFKERTAIKSHSCSRKLMCSRCGYTFTSLGALTSHKQPILATVNESFPFKCYLCAHMFVTQCGWNIHRRIHAQSHNCKISQQGVPSPSPSFSLLKELKTNVEVRLERISEAQLEAALFPKGSLLQDENAVSSLEPSKNLPSVTELTSSTGTASKPSSSTTMNAPVLNKDSVSNSYTELLMECHASSSGTQSFKSVRQPDDGTEDSVFPTASIKNQPAEKWTQSKPLIALKDNGVECDERSSSASDDLLKGLNSLSRKRKMLDCNHDMYNGVFPVEKILRWRNAKGRNEVRIKWMPCSVCGAKWKNTWEPAESFVSCKDAKNEETGSSDKQN